MKSPPKTKTRWKVPHVPIYFPMSAVEKWPRGTRNKVSNLVYSLMFVAQKEAAKGDLGHFVERLFSEDAPSSLSQVAHAVFSCPASRWICDEEQDKKPLTCLITSLALEGGDSAKRALMTLRSKGITQKLPLRTLSPEPLEDRPYSSHWTAQEMWFYKEVQRRISLEYKNGNRFYDNPYTVPLVWSEEEKSNHLEMAELLADSRVKSEKILDVMRGESVISTAAKYHMNHVLPTLISQGERLDVPSEHCGILPLQYALIYGNLEAAQLLVDAGADINAHTGENSLTNKFPADYRTTTLHTVLGGDMDEYPYKTEEDLNFVLEKTLPWIFSNGGHPEIYAPNDSDDSCPNANAKKGGRSLLSPLCIPWVSSIPALVNLLVANGASLKDESDGVYSFPISIMLANSAHKDSVKVAIDAGADLTVLDDDGNTLLHLAALGGTDLEGLQMLMDNGLSPIARNNKGETPLILSTSGDYDAPEAINLFLSQPGVEVDEADIHGETALLRSFSGNEYKRIKPKSTALLLAAGANPLVKDAQGKSCMRLLGEFEVSVNRMVDADDPNNNKMSSVVDVLEQLKKTGVVFSDMLEAIDGAKNPAVKALLEATRFEETLGEWQTVIDDNTLNPGSVSRRSRM